MNSDERKIKYSVFLIKDTYSNLDQIIDEDKVSEIKEIDEKYNIKGKIYFGHNSSDEPEWYKKLKEGIINPSELHNQSTRAVMLIRRKERIFAFVYGHGKHMIKPETYVRGFGMKVVLNNCAENKLKSIDSSKIDSVTVQARTQTSKSSELNQFQIDDVRDVLKAITAEAKDFDRYGKTIAGRDSFHFYAPFSYHNLNNICDMLLNDYFATKYKDNFEWIDYLNEVSDPTLKDRLNEQLLIQLNDIYNTGAEHNIHIAPPEIIDMENDIVFTYNNSGEYVDELELNDYISIKQPQGKNNYDMSKLKRDKISIYNNSTDMHIDTWPVYNCLITETELDGYNYILSLGVWYSINQDFVTQINEFLKDVETCPLKFHDYNHKNENDFNESVANHETNIISMDRVNISIDRSRFEFCDLLSNENYLIHVKPWSSSSTLSHLFAQGRISAETVINTPEIVGQINSKIKEQGGDDSFLIDKDKKFGPDYTIVFAIIYQGKKDIHERLPFFSKLNFVDTVKALKRMQFTVQKMHIDKV